ncbi:MAG: hypothetical protein WD067_04210 [Gaiellaceae bacterium]
MTVEEIVERGGEADDVLREVVDALHADGIAWVGIAFVEEGLLELGPSSGGEPPEELRRQPVEWRGDRVAELQASSDADPELLGRVAGLISPYCLVGWDTHGERWEP